MAHQIKDAHPRRKSDYVGPTCVQVYVHYGFHYLQMFYLFYTINESGQCQKRLGEASRMVAYGGS